MAYSPDGSTIAVGQNDGSLLILDSVSLEKVVGYKERKEAISDIKFSPGNMVGLALVLSLLFRLIVSLAVFLLRRQILGCRFA